MLLPASREQIRKLGERLASDQPIAPEDDHQLEELVACHLHALELARPRLNGLSDTFDTGPLHITARAKTTGTIIEKLRREHGMSLARMGDLAGFRIVGAFGFAAQDSLCDEICSRFPPDPRGPKRIDRRANPSHGYRALHVAVTFDGVSIEIQIRTVLQHIWADLMERLADRMGRQIRYGEPPTPPQGMNQQVADMLVRLMMEMSSSWANREWIQGDHLDVDAVTDDLWSELSQSLKTAGVNL